MKTLTTDVISKYDEFVDDYAPQGIFTEDDDDIDNIKQAVFNDLDEIERRVLLTYAENGSMRETADIFGVSLGTMHSTIKKIREKVLCCI